MERLSVPGELQRAIQEGRLVLHYQPIFALDDGAIAGVEALVRWAHPTRGLLPPSEFIPTAESTGQIVPIGRWVIDEAVGQAAAWRRQSGREILLSVNLSAAELEDPSIVTTVRTALVEHGLPPGSLVIELTESLELERDSMAVTLDHIHALGVRVAIDDFGTGYSSLGSLGRLSIDFLKMDRAFVDAIASAGREATLGAAIVQLGAALGLPTVAEGIDAPAQLARLRELGVQYGQGFLLDPPMSADAVAARLAEDVQESATPQATKAPTGRRRLSVGHACLSPG